MRSSSRGRVSVRVVLGMATVSALASAGPAAREGRARVGTEVTQEQSVTRREFVLSARKYAFSPDRLEINQDDLVKITLQAEDIAHSFTSDQYRIAKRASPGQVVVFEFRADQPGTFPFYCNLTADDGCRAMRGEIIVRPGGR